ncbi:hypothetical protein VCHA50O384_100054 [Vibrio chagasii]|nr:hypothetical protein VCHA50O384_100054 [Vibrio chagasii]
MGMLPPLGLAPKSNVLQSVRSFTSVNLERILAKSVHLHHFELILTRSVCY